MSNQDILMAFIWGIIYGVLTMGIAMIWLKATTTEWKHSNGEGTIDIYEVTLPSFGRIFYVVIASLFWPLTLALVILHGLLRIPLLIYQKTEKKDER